MDIKFPDVDTEDANLKMLDILKYLFIYYEYCFEVENIEDKQMHQNIKFREKQYTYIDNYDGMSNDKGEEMLAFTKKVFFNINYELSSSESINKSLKNIRFVSTDSFDIDIGGHKISVPFILYDFFGFISSSLQGRK